MKRPFYVILFSVLGFTIGAIVAWSTEFAYLTMLDYQSINDISASLGYAFDRQDAFNYVYLLLVAIGSIVGAVQGFKMWDLVYGDRIIPLRQRNRIVTILLYVILAFGVLALATVTDVFGFKEVDTVKSSLKKDVSTVKNIEQTATLFGIVLLDEQCGGDMGTTTLRERCAPRPYKTEFALFKSGQVEKVVESNENGSFEVSVVPGEYEVRVLPGSKAQVNLKNAIFLAEGGERTKIEVRYTEVGKKQ